MIIINIILYILLIIIKIVNCNSVASPYELGIIIESYLNLPKNYRAETGMISDSVRTNIAGVSEENLINKLAQALIGTPQQKPNLVQGGFFNIFNKNHATVDDLINDINDYNSKAAFTNKFTSAFMYNTVYYKDQTVVNMMDKIKKSTEEVKTYGIKENLDDYNSKILDYITVVGNERFRDMVKNINNKNCYVLSGENLIKCKTAFNIDTDNQKITAKDNLNLKLAPNRDQIKKNVIYIQLRRGKSVDLSHLRLTNVANEMITQLSTCNK